MALGNRKSESAADAEMPASSGPPFPEPAGSDGLISSLDDRLQQLQATVAALVERTSGTATLPEGDAGVAAASRTLKMAEQTAEATVTEARDEAAKLIGDAREQHDAMLQAAREAADVEFAAQREAVSAEAAGWDARRRALLDVLRDLDARLTECDTRLADAHRMVREALTHPVVSVPVTSGASDSVAATVPPAPVAPVAPVVEAEVVEPEPEPAAPAPAETIFGNPPAPVFTGPAKEGAETQAFYPWSGNTTASGPQDSETLEAPTDVPAPPVQRRGLFGH